MAKESAHLLSNLHTDDDFDENTSGSTLYTPFKSQESCRSSLVAKVTFLLLLASIALNATLLIFQSRAEVKGQSPYVGLSFNENNQLWWNTKYSSQDENQVNELWINSIPWESGIIAMGNEEALSMNLPKSQPWPWDSKNKSIYILNAHHILHCVRNLYISIQEYRHNETQSVEWPHILHCLDSIRQETICSADDTPRYVPLNSVHGFRPGDGQVRRCKSWEQMQKFVTSHDPCYKYIEPGNKNLSNLERFKYCPRDSPYLPVIRGYFGKSEDWFPGDDDQ